MYQHPHLCRLAELANRLGLPAAWLRELAEHGEIPSLLAPGTSIRLYHVGAVETALARLAASEPTAAGGGR